MPGFTLLDLTAQVRTIGRASVFYATLWDGIVDLQDGLTQLADSEGEIGLETGEEYSDLTLPELTGPAIHERFLQGLNPVITMPLYLADPALRAITTPTIANTGSAGFQRRQLVSEKTFVLFPEQLFYEDGAIVTVDYTTAGGWTVDGNAATATQLAYIDQSLWIWRGHLTFPPLTFRDADAGKAVDDVSLQMMHAKIAVALIPDGQRLFTYGDPADSSIDISPSG